MYYLLTGIKPSLPPMNLYEVFYGDVKIDATNCIYRILNKVNHKSYIGQAKWLMGRMRKGYYTHKGGFEDKSATTILYRALRKYGLDNFELSVLECNLKKSELNDRERYWIRSLDTCVYSKSCSGYNMTYGGEDTSQLHTPAARKKAIATQIERYGMMPYNSPESTRRSLETQRKANGGLLPFNTPEHYERMTELRGGDYMANCHTKESIGKRIQSDMNNHGGVMGFNTKECIDALVNRNKDKDLIHKCQLGRMFSDIKRAFKLGGNTDLTNFFKVSHYSKKYYIGILPDLRNDPRWTEEMNQLFKDL